MALNVNKDVADQFYRYKMPELIAKVEGKGNGIKTVIVNMSDIAKALYRPPMYPTKYFGCELGAQIQYDSKNERYIVNGSHTGQKLQSLLHGFIKKFVLCDNCSNPETDLHVKRGIVTTRCRACGHTGTLDARHRLTTFIIKNPPEDKKGKKGSEGASHSPDHGDGAESGTNGMGLGVAAENGEDDDDDWGEDVSDAAVKERMSSLSSAARNMAISGDMEKSTSEKINMVHAMIKTMKAEAEKGGIWDYRKIVNEAARLDVKDKAVMVVAEVLLDENVLKQVQQHHLFFRQFCYENAKAQRYLLGALENLIGIEEKEKLLPRTAVILKKFYDLDILDEENLLDWGAKVSKKYVSREISREIHAQAEKFITWLKEAEEESSEEDEAAVDFSMTGRVGVIDDTKPSAAPSTTKQAAEAAEDEGGDDVDIDDI